LELRKDDGGTIFKNMYKSLFKKPNGRSPRGGEGISRRLKSARLIEEEKDIWKEEGKK